MIKGQLTDTDRTEIVKYRLEKAYRTYNEARECKLNCVKLQ